MICNSSLDCLQPSLDQLVMLFHYGTILPLFLIQREIVCPLSSVGYV